MDVRSTFWETVYRATVALLVSSLTACAWSLPLRAQSAANAQPVASAERTSSRDTSDIQWELSLPNVTVTATRLPTPALTSPARISVFDSTSIAQTGASSVSDLLEDRAGLHVRRYGETGIATMSLRGTGSAQTVVLLDGHAIADPQLGQLDLSLLPSTLIRSVEVMHGPASALYGSSGMGGAIHLQTVRPTEESIARASTFAGAYGERGGSLLTGTHAGSVSVVAAGEIRHSTNNFPYLDQASFPPQTVQRQNADRTRYTGYAAVRGGDDKHPWQTAAWFTHAERGLPRPGAAVEGDERQWDTQFRFWARDKQQASWGQLESSMLVQHTQLRYRNPSQNVDDTGRTWTANFDVEGRVPIGSRWLATSGINGDVSLARHPNLQDDAHQWHAGAFTSAIGTFGRLRLFPAIRIDLYVPPAARTRTAMSPRMGANFQPISTWESLRLKAHVGSTFRMPTFNDRFWQPGGNPDLQPERGWSADAGVHWQQPAWHAEATVFHNWRHDQIIWSPVRSGSWSPENEQRVIARGVEFSSGTRLSLTERWTVDTGLTYTYTDARNRSQPGTASYNAPLRYLPREQAKWHGTLTYGPVALDLNARYTGRRYISSTGSRYLDAYIVTDAQIRVTHTFDSLRAQLSLRADNLTGADYRTVGNRPMPPRHLHVRLMVEL
ncbi:hypothetical protein CRI94_12300 [Longibacter salinarum]|uniref:TonB-dependent receptor n=1 Tax=Longibacter salinarum TaxID=1850348 RepID=A0A2A8CVL0_9BACT|nr:TonB-dependent receptor [Longibacter salinarum]PEN12789.1 hypothetical protein CRI94_12300 [Longibacter salinarum]